MARVALIRERMLTAQSRQKSYADRRRIPLEFRVGSHVWLRVSPTRGVRRFGIKGKLSPRYVGPFEILDRVGSAAYRVALPPRLEGVHPVFHVSQLREYIPDPRHTMSYDDVTPRIRGTRGATGLGSHNGSRPEPDNNFIESCNKALTD